MVIALLAVLGVNLIVIVAILVIVAARRRWVSNQPGAFKGAIRVSAGEVAGLSTKWHRGYGRWVNDVLVWTKAPFMFRNEVLATHGAAARGPAPHDPKRLGDHPVVLTLRADGGTVEVAAEGDDEQQLLGPYREQDRPAPLT